MTNFDLSVSGEHCYSSTDPDLEASQGPVNSNVFISYGGIFCGHIYSIIESPAVIISAVNIHQHFGSQLYSSPSLRLIVRQISH